VNNEDLVTLQSYKHDGSLHRVWKTEKLLADNEEYIVLANQRTRVVESNGRFWYTKEPSVAFFFKNHWYNVIGIIKKNEISYYCNLSSPILRDDEAIKYIDYDLDIKVAADYKMTLLDSNEYHRNQERMQYPEDIKTILQIELDDLKKRIEARDFPFKKEIVKEWYNKYLKTEGEQ